MEDGFWDLIDHARARGRNCVERARELESILSKMPSTEIEAFASAQVSLMQTSYRWDLWGAAFVINGGCSDDGFECFRGWLMLQGRDVWEAALRDPESLADVPLDGNADCEDILYAASEAYERVTGLSLPSHGEPRARRPAGPAWEEDDLETLYPRLWKRSVTRRPSGAGDDWDQMMGLGMSMLASGAFEPAAQAFSSVRQHAPRQLTRTIATNNLAWTNLMIGTPEAVREALSLANESLRMVNDQPDNERYLGSIRGTLAFALIRNEKVDDGLDLIEDVLTSDPSGPQMLALRYCVKAIGLARSGDAAAARHLISKARQADPTCQLLPQALSAVAVEPAPLPAELERLSPWLERFGIADDLEREQAVERATNEELVALVGAVDRQTFDQINRYLDATDDAEAGTGYGDLAQAAMEAQLELRRRGLPGT